MTVLLLGCGSIGLRHLRNLRALGQEVLVYDPDSAALAVAVKCGGVRATSITFETCGHVVIASPVSEHVASAIGALMCGSRVFIEKPLATTAEAAKTLLRYGARIQVGYQLRFDPALNDLCAALPTLGRILSARIEFGQHLGQWTARRPLADTPYAQTGIVLEASHELDLVRWLFGEWITCSAVTRRELGLPAEDTVAGIIQTADGVLVELHMDMTRPRYRRRIEVVGTDDTFVWELNSRRVNDLYLAEMRAFLDGGSSPGVEDGIAALELAEAIRGSARTGQTAVSARGWGTWDRLRERVFG